MYASWGGVVEIAFFGRAAVGKMTPMTWFAFSVGDTDFGLASWALTVCCMLSVNIRGQLKLNVIHNVHSIGAYPDTIVSSFALSDQMRKSKVHVVRRSEDNKVITSPRNRSVITRMGVGCP